MKRTNYTERNPFGLPNIVIPAELLFNEELTNSEKILFGFLSNLSSNEQGYCWASNRYLGRLNNVRPETVSNMISKLCHLGYLRVEHEVRYDGTQVRKIWIDPTYAQRYQGMLQDALRKIFSPLKQTIKGAKANDKWGISESLTNIDNELDKELDNSSYSSDSTDINGKITPSQFEAFWKIYPRKVDKGKAKTAWERICSRKNGTRPTWKELRKAIHDQKKSERWKDPTFIPHPTTWLNQQRWLDDPAEMKSYEDRDKPKSRVNIGSGITGQFEGLEDWLEQQRKEKRLNG